MPAHYVQQDKRSTDNKSMDIIKGMSSGNGSAKSSKSVTFTSHDTEVKEKEESEESKLPRHLTGLPLEDAKLEPQTSKVPARSASKKYSSWVGAKTGRKLGLTPSGISSSAVDDDLWLLFLVETGLLQASDPSMEFGSDIQTWIRAETMKVDDPEFILKLLAIYRAVPGVTSEFTTHSSTSIRDSYDNIHRNYPGLFYDTITMDDLDVAFKKAKRIIKRLVESKKHMRPMFDIDFVNLPEQYPLVQERIKKLASEIGQKRLFL